MDTKESSENYDPMEAHVSGMDVEPEPEPLNLNQNTKPQILSTVIQLNPESNLLQLWEKLPDVRVDASKKIEEGEEISSEELTRQEAKLKAEYLTKKIQFVSSELQRHISPCQICKLDIQSVHYEFFRDGVKLPRIDLDGMTLHKITTHGERFPKDVEEFLLPRSQIQNRGRKAKVDRANTCPFLLRIYIKHNEAHKEDDFSVILRGKEPQNEIQIHTWKDATLREVVDLLKEVEPITRNWGTKVNISFVYPDKRGKNVMKEIAILDAQKEGKDDHKTLDDYHFLVGDMLAITLFERK